VGVRLVALLRRVFRFLGRVLRAARSLFKVGLFRLRGVEGGVFGVFRALVFFFLFFAAISLYTRFILDTNFIFVIRREKKYFLTINGSRAPRHVLLVVDCRGWRFLHGNDSRD